MKLLEGKTVAMTGGGGGLGRCYGLAMAKAGAAVAVSDINLVAAQATTDAIIKAGIIGFTRAVSLELKDTGVRINCFGPGATDTPLWRVGKSEEDIRRLLAAGFVYQPDDFSNVVVFLASDLSAPLNGEFISRDLHR